MASSALGTKRHCQSCSGKFYDLNKDPIICPLCNTAFDPEVLLKSRRSKPVAALPSKPAAAPAENENTDDSIEEDIEDVDNDIENEDEVLDDDSDLIVVSKDGDEEEAGAGPDDLALEDNLDSVDAEDEAEEE